MFPKFELTKAATLQEALREIGENNGTPVCGGTDLLVQLRGGVRSAAHVVDISGIAELTEIREEDSGVFIGAACPLSAVQANSAVAEHFPALWQAVSKVGSAQIRNAASLGGNVQTASPAADGLVALMALDATVCLVSSDGAREMPISQFNSGFKKTELRGSELIRGFYLKKSVWDFQEFFKIGRRNALAISVVNGAVCIRYCGDGRIEDAAIVLGAVSPAPIRLKAVEQVLMGCAVDCVDEQKLRDAVVDSISPISDIRASKEYRSYIAGVMVNRMLRSAAKKEVV